LNIGEQQLSGAHEKTPTQVGAISIPMKTISLFV
jgi:hypothetical protein